MTIEPPVCKVCGKAHWMRDPHPGMEDKAAAILKVRKVLDLSPVPGLDRYAIAPTGKVIKGPTSKPKPKPKRRK